jgi:hypothetical protein
VCVCGGHRRRMKQRRRRNREKYEGQEKSISSHLLSLLFYFKQQLSPSMSVAACEALLKDAIRTSTG